MTLPFLSGRCIDAAVAMERKHALLGKGKVARDAHVRNADCGRVVNIEILSQDGRELANRIEWPTEVVKWKYLELLRFEVGGARRSGDYPASREGSWVDGLYDGPSHLAARVVGCKATNRRILIESCCWVSDIVARCTYSICMYVSYSNHKRAGMFRDHWRFVGERPMQSA